MKRIFPLIGWLLLVNAVFAQQNLIKNPTFEDRWVCPNPPNPADTVIQHWRFPLTPSERYPSDADSCRSNWYYDYYSVGLNFWRARSGHVAPWFISYGFWRGNNAQNLDSRTYIVSQLKQPLKSNEIYYFEMYMRRLPSFYENWGLYATSGQAVQFSETPPTYTDNGSLRFGPITPTGRMLQNRDSVWRDTNWSKFSGCFTANGKEAYASIGVFLEERNINRVITRENNASNGEVGYFGYYSVDDLLLIPLKIGLPTDTAICEGDTLTLDARRNVPVTHLWEDGGSAAVRKITKAGEYKLYVNYNPNQLGCTVEETVKVTVIPKTTRTRSFDTLACDGRTVVLKAGYGTKNESYRWQDSSKARFYNTRKEGDYWAKIQNECGNFLDSFHVKYENCQISVFAPNAFSPNGDSNNDVFKPFVNQSSSVEVLNYQCQIFDRWGQKIFSTTDLQMGWDGNFRGQAAETGVYVWQIQLTAKLGDQTVARVFSGDVSLLK